jgi:hypothetical protein
MVHPSVRAKAEREGPNCRRGGPNGKREGDGGAQRWRATCIQLPKTNHYCILFLFFFPLFLSYLGKVSEGILISHENVSTL